MTCGFKYDMRNLVNFHLSTLKSENFTSIGYFCPKYLKFELKKIQSFHDAEQWCKIWIYPDLAVSKMAWGIGWTFIRVPKSLEIVHWYIDGLFLCKAYTISVRKFQKNYVSWHGRVLQSLNKNWRVAWKMTQGIWLIFILAVESPKICILIGSVCPKHTNILMKKYRSIMSHDAEEEWWHWKVWRKTDSWFQNYMRNVVNVNASSG